MPRIAGVDIPNDKKIRISLRYIYGVGPTNALAILKEAGIDPERLWCRAAGLDCGGHRDEHDRSDCSGSGPAFAARSREHRGALRRQIQQNIGRLREIGSHRGNRHRRSLPVRGQRTRSNARTRKGPRKTVAGKKGVKELGK